MRVLSIRYWMILLSCMLLFSACSPVSSPSTASSPGALLSTPSRGASEAPATLTVMAAASLTEAFTEIGQLLETQNPGLKVEFSFAGSQQLAQQLANAAPGDVFASASQKYMDSAVQSGRVSQGAAKVFVRNRLLVIFPKANPAGLASLADLARPGLKLVLAAKEVPVGQYAQDFMDKAAQDPGFSPSYKADVLKNVVSYEDNVKSVLTKVALGEADAGIVFTSDVSGEAAAQVGQIPIPDALNVIAAYPIAPIKDSPHALQAQAFVDLVLSPAGQAVLAKYGFIPVSQP